MAPVAGPLSEYLARCGVEVKRADAARDERSWVYLTPDGPTSFLHCRGCGYLAECDIAAFALPDAVPAPLEPMREVATPGASTIRMIKLPGGATLAEVAERLEDAGLDILIDDRDFSAGVKLAEADWIGAPVVIVSGRKSAEGGEVEVRSPSDEKRIIPLEGAAAASSRCFAKLCKHP
jgi:prolyl-tRNA synthetase